jgi:hypothetical protein
MLTAINTKTKIGICVGVLIAFAAPFVQNLIAYLEGREVFSFGTSLLSFLICLTAGSVIGIIILLWSFFDKTQRKIRLLFGFLLLFGSPVFFGIFVQAAAKLELRGLADETKSKINIVALQSWAMQTLNEQHFLASTNSTYDPAQTSLDWNRVPADARAFIGTNGAAFIEVWSDGRTNVLLNAEPDAEPIALRIGTTNFMFPTDEFWNYKLAPGIYLGHDIRP